MFVRVTTLVCVQFERLGYGRPLIHLPVSLVYSAGGTRLKCHFVEYMTEL